MHPTGSGTGTAGLFGTFPPHQHATAAEEAAGMRRAGGYRRLMRAVWTLAAGIAVSLPVTGAAQGPIQPASYGYPAGPWQGSPPPFSAPGYDYGPGCNSGGYGGCGPCPETIYELLPDDRCSFGDDTCCAALASAMQHAYIRVEYLNWNIDDTGRQIVGAPRASDNEREPFNAIDPNSQTIVGLAELLTYDAVGFSHNNGVRGVFGLPTRIGLFEAGVSVLEQSGVHLTDETFIDFRSGNPVFPAVTLLLDGVPNDTTMILFSEGLNVQMKAEFFSTEANFIMHPLTPNQPFQVMPLCGFQYVRFWDNVDIFGTDINLNDIDDPNDNVTLNHRIQSDAKNNVFAPQVGARFEFVHEHFTLGVTPKFMLGFNRHRDEVFSEQIFSVNEGRNTTHEEDSEFSPGLDLSVYGRVHLNKHLSLFVSYQLYYIDNISRATDNILYDSISTTPLTPNIVLNPHQEGMFVDGVTVGGEFRFN